MKQDEIIEMAKQAGMGFNQSLAEFRTPFCDGVEIEELEAFAKLVAAKEREACAQICENYADTDSFQYETSGGITTDFHAKLIRARGEA